MALASLNSSKKNRHVGAQGFNWGDFNGQICNQGDEKPYSGYKNSLFMDYDFFKITTPSTLLKAGGSSMLVIKKPFT